MIVGKCDKCGQDVTLDNDAVSLDFLHQFGQLPDTFERLINGGCRHLLPEGECEGSPSRAQYLEGQPRDTRGYEYDASYEVGYREAYGMLLKF